MSEPINQNTQDDFCLQPPALNKAVLLIENTNDFNESITDEQIPANDSKYVLHSNNLHTDNLCPLGLRKDLGRVDFAQKHLFRGGNLEEEQEDEEDFSDNLDESFTSDEDSMLEADLTENSCVLNGVSDESIQINNRALELSESLEAQGSFNQASTYLENN